MKKGTHGRNEDKFEKLDYKSQASSLNAQMLYLKKALNAHFRKGKEENKDVNSSKKSYNEQLSKIIEFINEN
ncbi:MAG: hypothetical protein WCY89_10975 [Flavobacteriaceae bacterium]